MLISMAKKGWKRAQAATVTRRDGWRKMADDLLVIKYSAAEEYGVAILDDPGWRARHLPVLEMVEWSPRVGPRWVCARCEVLGPKRLQVAAPDPGRPIWTHCGCPPVIKVEHRQPRRGLYIRVVDARRECLADMPASDLIREGFPDLGFVEFWRLYLGRPSWSDVRVVEEAGFCEVTRIEYEHLEARP